jgi:predicted PurR-regulated permease PerM
MKKIKKLSIITLLLCLCFFSTITISYAVEASPNLIEWLHTQVDKMVNNSISNIESEVNAKKEELMEQIEIEKERAAEDLEKYKQEQLELYHQQLSEIVSEKNSLEDDEKNTTVSEDISAVESITEPDANAGQ